MSVVFHAKTDTIPDATGVVTVGAFPQTSTVNATDLVRPSDFNSAHLIAYGLLGNTAGISSVSGTNVFLAGGNNVTLSASQGIDVATISINGGAGGGGGGIGLADSAATITTGTVVFSNSNNVLFGLAGSTMTASASFPAASAFVFSNSNGVSFGTNGSTVTATVQTNYLTTARASNDGIGLNTAQSNVTWTVNSSGLSLDARGYAGTGTTFNGANVSGSLTQNSNGLQVSLSVGTALTSQSNQNVTAANGGFAFQTLSFSNAQGVSFATSAGSAIVGSVVTSYAGQGFTSTTTAGTAIVGTLSTNGLSIGVPTIITNALTTARASTDAIGLNTAQSNVTWTVNSSGLSLDARGYAGTGTTFAGTNVSASVTLNSVGLNFALSVPNVGAGNVTFSAGAASAGLASIVFSNSNGVSFGLNGSTITASAAAGAEVTISRFRNYMNAYVVNTVGTAQANSLASIFPLEIQAPLSASNMKFGLSLAPGTAANNSTVFYDASYSAVVYTRNGSTLSSIASGAINFTTTWTSNNTGSVGGAREFTLTFGGTNLFNPGEYWVGLWFSTNNTATGGANTTAVVHTVSMLLNGAITAGNIAGLPVFGTNVVSSHGLNDGLGCLTLVGTQATIAISDVRHTQGFLANLICDIRNYTL